MQRFKELVVVGTGFAIGVILGNAIFDLGKWAMEMLL